MTLERATDPKSMRVAVCEMCKGNGIIPVRLRFGARAKVEVVKGGVAETVAYKETGWARCRCTKGERFQKNFNEFNHSYMVSQYPGGEEIAREVAGVQQEMSF